MKPLSIKMVSVITFLCLFIVAFSIVYQGPLQEIMSGTNMFVKSMLNLNEIENPIKWPDANICKSPFDRNTEKYYEFLAKGRNHSFIDESEYKTFIEESYFTKPEDFIYAFGFGTSYESASDVNKKILPQLPYVTSSFLDVAFFGYCATIHFEELRSKLIEDGEIDEKEIDSTFFAIIGLKVKSSLLSFLFK